MCCKGVLECFFLFIEGWTGHFVPTTNFDWISQQRFSTWHIPWPFESFPWKAQQQIPGDGEKLLDFAEVSFFNHCCAGLSNATWTWNLGFYNGREVTCQRSKLLKRGEIHRGVWQGFIVQMLCWAHWPQWIQSRSLSWHILTQKCFWTWRFVSILVGETWRNIGSWCSCFM